jgi:hypothetical protein
MDFLGGIPGRLAPILHPIDGSTNRLVSKKSLVAILS